MITFHLRTASQREVQCRCTKCGNMCDGIFQHRAGEEWAPSPFKTLEVLGWIPDGERWFCSKFCRDVYAHSMTREDPIKGVTTLSAPLGPAQRAYSSK